MLYRLSISFFCLRFFLIQHAFAQAQDFQEVYAQAVQAARQQNYTKALQLSETILPQAEKVLGENSLNLSNFLNSVAGFYELTQQESLALPFYQKVAQIRSKTLASNHPEYLKTLNKLANLYFKLGKYSEANSSYQEILAVNNPEAPLSFSVLFNAHSNLGFLKYHQRKWASTDSLYLIAEKYLASIQPTDTLLSIIHLERKAQLFEATQQQTEALQVYQKLLPLQEQFYGVLHPYYLPSVYKEMRLYNQASRSQEAIELFERIPALAWQELDKESKVFYEINSEVSWAYLLIQNSKKAESLLNSVSLETLTNLKNPDLLGRYWYLKGKLAIQENHKEAVNSSFENAWKSYQMDNALQDSSQVLQVLYDWGAWCYEQRDFVQAESIWEKAIEYHKTSNLYELAALDIRYNLSTAQQQNKKLSEAQTNYEYILDQKSISHTLEALVNVQLARLYLSQGLSLKALNSYQTARDTWEKSSVELPLLYYQAGQEEAFIYQNDSQYEQAQAILKKLLRLASPSQEIEIRTQSALVAYLNGQYAEAQKQYQAILDFLQQKSLSSSVLLSTLNNLGNLYKNQGFFSEAETVLLKAKNISETETSISPDSKAYTLNNLGNLYRSLGRYLEAEMLIEEALKVIKNQKETSKNVEQEILLSQANLLRQKGQFAPAEILYRKSLVFFEQKVEYASFYQEASRQLGLLYLQTGRYEQAVLLLEQLSKKSDEILLGELGGQLATAYQKTNQAEKAEALLIKIISIRKKYWGIQHPDIATAQDQLGYLYRQKGDYESAQKLFEEAQSLRQKIFGESHPSLAISKHNFALLAEYRQDKTGAERLHLESLEIIRKKLGEGHPFYLQALNNLATFYEKNKAAKKAFMYYQEALEKLKIFVKQNMSVLSEQEKRQFWQSNQILIQNFLSFTAQSVATSEAFKELNLPRLWGEALNLRLDTKGLLLTQARNAQSDFEQDNDPEIKAIYTQWLANKEWLAHHYARKSSGNLDKKIDSLQKVSESLEKELTLRTQSFAEELGQKKLTWQKIQSRLKKKEAALEMIRLPEQKEEVWYLALIILPAPAEPIPILLREGQLMDESYWAYYRNNIRFQRKDTQSFDRYWADIQAVLDKEGIQKLYFSPDGVYHLLNIASFYEPSTQQYLDEKLEIIQLASLQDLQDFDDARLSKADASLWGSPAYSLTEKKEKNTDYQDLIHTETEIKAIETLLQDKNWKVSTTLGEQAREENLKKMPKTAILHLATHGYFELETKALVSEDTPMGTNLGETTWLNPLIQSGLVWAGVNTPQLLSNNEDGKLTALEVSQLPLSETELVVLSACQTGLGKVESGEGVYGLQRAFQVAGAKRLLMSLWEVNDQVTQEFMGIFYENLLKNQSPGEALKITRAEIRQKYPHPYYWAAFVLLER